MVLLWCHVSWLNKYSKSVCLGVIWPLMIIRSWGEGWGGGGSDVSASTWLHFTGWHLCVLSREKNRWKSPRGRKIRRIFECSRFSIFPVLCLWCCNFLCLLRQAGNEGIGMTEWEGEEKVSSWCFRSRESFETRGGREMKRAVFSTFGKEKDREIVDRV